MKANEPMNPSPTPLRTTYFHGTKADLSLGDCIEIGYVCNYDASIVSKYNFCSSTLDAAIWGAELAQGNGKPRIYLVKPMGDIEDDPDLTDKKFPGNPSQSYRTKAPLRIVGEVGHWQGHTAEQVQAMKAGIAALLAKGIQSENDV